MNVISADPESGISFNRALVRATCHCGAVELEAPAPADITECNCSICRRYGVLWAYYDPSEVLHVKEGSTDTYAGDDRSIDFHRCEGCGCACYWSAVDPEQRRMGINARLMDPTVLQGLRIRHLDGAVTEDYVD